MLKFRISCCFVTSLIKKNIHSHWSVQSVWNRITSKQNILVASEYELFTITHNSSCQNEVEALERIGTIHLSYGFNFSMTVFLNHILNFSNEKGSECTRASKLPFLVYLGVVVKQ